MGSVAEKKSSFHNNLPACTQGLPRILHWQPSFCNSRSYRNTLASAEALASAEEAAALVSLKSRHRSSQHNFPACNRGLPHTLHWKPSFRNSRSNRSTLASAEALASAEVAAALVSLLKSRHRSSQHNFPACKRGLPHILHWRPNLRNSDSRRSTLASAEDLASAVALESVLQLGRTHRSNSLHNWPGSHRKIRP